MPAGIYILNDSGTVQIDENWRNFGFRAKTPLDVHIPANQNFLANTYSFSVAGEAVLIAPVTTNLCVNVVRTEFSGGVWTFHLIILRQFHQTYAEYETAQIYVYDVMPVSGFGNVGLEVFNAAGERVFHSDMNPMKSRQVLSGDTGYTGTSGRVYAPLFLTHTRHFDPINGIQYWGLRSYGDYITSIEINVAGGGFTGTNTNAGLYAAVDVTGL